MRLALIDAGGQEGGCAGTRLAEKRKRREDSINPRNILGTTCYSNTDAGPGCCSRTQRYGLTPGGIHDAARQRSQTRHQQYDLASQIPHIMEWRPTTTQPRDMDQLRVSQQTPYTLQTPWARPAAAATRSMPLSTLTGMHALKWRQSKPPHITTAPNGPAFEQASHSPLCHPMDERASTQQPCMVQPSCLNLDRWRALPRRDPRPQAATQNHGHGSPTTPPMR